MQNLKDIENLSCDLLTEEVLLTVSLRSAGIWVTNSICCLRHASEGAGNTILDHGQIGNAPLRKGVPGNICRRDRGQDPQYP